MFFCFFVWGGGDVLGSRFLGATLGYVSLNHLFSTSDSSGPQRFSWEDSSEKLSLEAMLASFKQRHASLLLQVPSLWNCSF